MKRYPFMQVDAFADRALAGNPCAIVFDCDDMSVETMQAIAQENNLSETAFVLRPTIPGADVRVRYFTPGEEIPLAGHPTIATAFALVDSGRITLAGPLTTLTFQMQVGPIQVDIHAREGRMTKAVMTQQRPQFFDVLPAADVMPVFGLAPEDALPGAPIQVVSTGTRQLMIPVRGHDALRRAALQPAPYLALRQRGGFFSPHLFCLQGATSAGRTFARHFGTPPDTFEDPFTGSATGNMGAYVWRYGLIDTPRFQAEQGHWMGRPGIAEVEVLGPRDAIESVKVGGAAAAVIRGELSL